MSKLLLHLVRHGESTANAERRIAGWTDAPLTESGQAQARSIREHLTARSYDGVWSSDLSRAVETGRLAFGETRRDSRIRELDFGDLEGCSWDRLDLELLERIADFRSFAAPGGESVRAMEERVRAFIDELVDGDHLVFTHGGVIRLLLQDLGVRRFVSNCSVVVLNWRAGEIVSEHDPAGAFA